MIAIDHIRSVLSRYTRGSVSPEKYPAMSLASVLILLVELNGELHLVLTERSNDVETHKGQISFPGGACSAGDTDAIATALRESNEEIGLPYGTIDILGIIDDFVTPTQFIITPVVGYAPSLPGLIPNATEVAEIFFVPLSFFADEKNGYTELRSINGKEYTVWFFPFGKHLIWGATAAMIRRFLEIISKKGTLS